MERGVTVALPLPVGFDQLPDLGGEGLALGLLLPLPIELAVAFGFLREGLLAALRVFGGASLGALLPVVLALLALCPFELLLADQPGFQQLLFQSAHDSSLLLQLVRRVPAAARSQWRPDGRLRIPGPTAAPGIV